MLLPWPACYFGLAPLPSKMIYPWLLEDHLGAHPVPRPVHLDPDSLRVCLDHVHCGTNSHRVDACADFPQTHKGQGLCAKTWARRLVSRSGTRTCIMNLRLTVHTKLCLVSNFSEYCIQPVRNPGENPVT